MKRIIIACLAICVAICVADAKKKKGEEGSPRIQFEETVWDFGTIPNDRPAVHNFEFTNDGTGNLVILDASAQCGCTRPEWPEKPVAPGKKGKIKVTYNPIGRPGSFEKTVTIKTNGSPKKVHLKIRGTVKP